jgi:hypothetical protein
VVDRFFGDFANSLGAVSFGSTLLSIELGGSLFAGAAKAGIIAERRAAKVLGLVQRAGDRAERRRLDNSGKPLATQRCRAIWLFEDGPVTEGSAPACLLILPIPEPPRQPELMRRLLALMGQLPCVTSALVG